MAADFTRAGYGELLDAFAARGYACRGYDDAEPDARHLVLRHDIDMSLEAALPIAELEHAREVAAAYFVLVRTEMYNPFSGDGQRALLRLLELGHEIGLHLDPSLYGNDPSALDAAAGAECAVLETILDRPVSLVSFHRPSERLLGFEAKLAGRIHTYQPRFFRDMGYRSDSRGAWHHGHPLGHAAVMEGRALQLLTHPIWWLGRAGEGVREKLDRLVDARHTRLREELARNCEPYRLSLKAEGAGDSLE